MTLTNAEQYLLELINRARLNPAAEAARYGIDLNADLSRGTLGTQARQVLAPNELLEKAAIHHSQWMLANDIFDHYETGNYGPSDRVTDAGYRWTGVAENISWRGTTTTMNLEDAISMHHEGLFLSSGHRVNMLGDAYREVGLAQEHGTFQYSGYNLDTSMLTEVFGRGASAQAFLTGVAYSDRDNDNFYSIGEGRSGVIFRAQGDAARTAGAGGYALGVDPAAAVDVTGQVGTVSFSVSVRMDQGNVKLDVVDGDTFFTSGSVTLETGINSVRLLGVGRLDATGNDARNLILGNSGANVLNGQGSADRIYGSYGKDSMDGGQGNDLLNGGSGDDRLFGSDGADNLAGANGNDRLEGGIGADTLAGGGGADSFVFRAGFGQDRITDYSAAGGDSLQLDDALWQGTRLTADGVVDKFATIVQGHVELTFASGETIVLSNLSTLSGLADHITII